MGRYCPDVSEMKNEKGLTLVCKSVGIWDSIVNPLYGFGVEITPDINSINVGLERSCPRDSKNVSYVG